MTHETSAPLAPEDAARLMEFARGCKAAARAVLLYPDSHPAVAASLGRLAHLTSPENLPAPMRIQVTADSLLVDGRVPARPDAGTSELAALLHERLVGELVIRAGADVDTWRRFLQLLGRSPDDLRGDGGIGRLWTHPHIELREIDYAELLREKEGGDAPEPITWKRLIESCLDGQTSEIPDALLQELLDLGNGAKKVEELLTALAARSAGEGKSVEATTSAVLRLLRAIVEAVKTRRPDVLDRTLRNIAAATGGLPAEVFSSIFGGGTGEPDALVDAIAFRMTDATIAGLVSRSAATSGTAMDRLAEAFQTLVGETDRERVLAVARHQARLSPFGSTDGFDESWQRVTERMLRSYSDESFVSRPYARELSTARSAAVSVEETNEDPPERVAAWLATVSTSELRRLDLALVADLLRLESDDEHWVAMLPVIAALVEDLILVGDFRAACDLLPTVREHASAAEGPRGHAVRSSFAALASGPVVPHVISHLQTIDDAQFSALNQVCLTLGEAVIRPVAEALAIEERQRARERLTAIVVAFGAPGRQQVELLKSSANPAVRRTAVYLLREFGGTDALPDLTGLLNDREPQVQREAVRAILTIGTDRAFHVLEEALLSGSEASRDAIMRSVGTVRDERAAPLFSYILDHVDHRGPLSSIYLRAIEALGVLKDPHGIPALERALHRGEWWTPRRTSLLRRTAAAALARMGTPEAAAALDNAARHGRRGVRAAASAALPSAIKALDRRDVA
jgi:hypothetical protein